MLDTRAAQATADLHGAVSDLPTVPMDALVSRGRRRRRLRMAAGAVLAIFLGSVAVALPGVFRSSPVATETVTTFANDAAYDLRTFPIGVESPADSSTLPYRGAEWIPAEGLDADIDREIRNQVAAVFAESNARPPYAATVVFQLDGQYYVTLRHGSGGVGIVVVDPEGRETSAEVNDEPYVSFDPVREVNVRYRVTWLGLPEATTQVRITTPHHGSLSTAPLGGAGFFELTKPDWTQQAHLVAEDAAGNELDTVSLKLDGGGCSASRLAPLTPDNPDLPTPVGETRARLITAAVACDVATLAGMLEGATGSVAETEEQRKEIRLQNLRAELRERDLTGPFLRDLVDALKSRPDTGSPSRWEFGHDGIVVTIDESGRVVAFDVAG